MTPQTLIVSLQTDTASLDASTREWLRRGDVVHAPPIESPIEPLGAVLRLLGHEPPGNLAALRYAGQTGQAPGRWLACADPVVLEPMIDHVRVRVPGTELDAAEGQRLYAELNRRLGGDVEFEFRDPAGYVLGRALGPTPSVSAAVVDGREPSEFLPSGPEAPDFHRLMSEIQMTLHEAASRLDLHAVNALWIWGGGPPGVPAKRRLPALYSDDPLFRGYWDQAGGQTAARPAALAECAAGAAGAVVTAVDASTELLGEAKRLLNGRKISVLRLLFADGTQVHLRRWHRLRFWRRGVTGTAP